MSLLALALSACLTPFTIEAGPADCAAYLDSDGDGYGDPNACVPAANPQGVLRGDDCDDSDPSIFPDAQEICDGLDNNCNDDIDEDASDAILQWQDSDGDLYGDPDLSGMVCPDTPGWVQNSDDCDDSESTTRPNADEWCDEIDNDCNGVVDDNGRDAPQWFFDQDQDGHGAGFPVQDCNAPPSHVESDDDCDDNDNLVFPGQILFFTRQSQHNGWDYDCSGADEEQYPDPGYCEESCSSPVLGFSESLFGVPDCGESDWFVYSCTSLVFCFEDTSIEDQPCH